MKNVSPNKKCACFHNCRDIIIIIIKKKNVKSELSNEGRYFRNFAVHWRCELDAR